MKDMCQKGSIKKVERELPVAKNLSGLLPHNSIADTLLCTICQVRLLRFYYSTCKGFCSCCQLSVLQICQLLKIFTSVPVFLTECSFLDPSLNYYIY